MKITALSERIQAFQAIHDEKMDGEFVIKYAPIGWFWAQITPLSYAEKEAKSLAETCESRYEIVMRKKDIYHTGHAYISRVGWNHKLLDMYTPWREKQCKNYVLGLALSRNYGEQ